ncbi:GntR family transcriptional regulator [Lysinibacter cavernae]|uniref:DNA-binding GntR family transcriptional regulator n=1 Tax=Lysinibacter cavernae TaxID=1640652 RepID=A0A7X5R383_9MICO|nr:GntR family transcriptional regulator [Lysinibacter cavernae]NIH54854.1 DNA-binding GntR family transcriptional regulator [Lysinibacter cavernae]
MSLSSLSPLPKQPSLRETITNTLRAAIVTGEMAPNEVYSAPALSKRFGVSATPVREAMLDLISEGLVAPEPNKGFRVTAISDDDLDDLTSLRLLIEPRATRSVVNLIPTEDLPMLRGLADRIIESSQHSDLTEYVQADTKFHLTLMGYTGNQRLVALVSSLRSQTRLFGLTTLVQKGLLPASAAEHHELIELIEQRDEDAVEELMARHIGHVRGIWAAPTP